MRLLFAATLCASVLVHAVVTEAKDVVVHAGTLIDGTEGPARSKVSILITDQRITAVTAGFVTPAGSDQGASGGHNKAREFALLVAAGMTPREAILAGTLHAAQLIGAPADIGSVQAGRYSDIVAVTGNPLENIEVLQQVEFVMKGGEVLKADGRMLR